MPEVLDLGVELLLGIESVDLTINDLFFDLFLSNLLILVVDNGVSDDLGFLEVLNVSFSLVKSLTSVGQLSSRGGLLSDEGLPLVVESVNLVLVVIDHLIESGNLIKNMSGLRGRHDLALLSLLFPLLDE